MTSENISTKGTGEQMNDCWYTLVQCKRQFIGKEKNTFTKHLSLVISQCFSNPNLSFHRYRRVPEDQPIYLRAESTKDMSCVFWIPRQVIFLNKKHTPCFTESKIPLFLRLAIVLCSAKKYRLSIKLWYHAVLSLEIFLCLLKEFF